MENVTKPKQAVYEAAFLSVKQLSQALGCSKSNISVLIKKGTIPAVRLGSYPYVPVEWLQEQRQAAYASIGHAPEKQGAIQ
jgi:excisionase family DNA binding protein